MEIIKGQINTVLVYDLPTDTTVTKYLINMYNDVLCIDKRFIVTNTSANVCNLELSFTEDDTEDLLNGVVSLLPGHWTFDVYEQPKASESTNLDISLAILMQELSAKVTGEDCVITGSTTECPPAVILDSDELTTVLVPAGESFACTPAGACADATYENSDQTFQQNIASGATFVAPDVTHTDSDGSPVIVPANIALVCTPAGGGFTDIAYTRPSLTGETTDYGVGSNGYHFQLGTYLYTTPEGGKQTKLVDFYTLADNNFFGNTDRFTNDLGGNVFDGSDTSTADYVIDNYTGLGYRTKRGGSMTWVNCLSNAEGATYFGFTDWRLPNRNEWQSVGDKSLSQCWNNGIFAFTSFEVFSSTTTGVFSTSAYSQPANGSITLRAKTNLSVPAYVRNHFN